MHLPVFFPNKLLFILGTNITIIDIYDKQENQRSVAKFLSKIEYKWEQAKRHWNLLVNSSFDSVHFSVNSEKNLKNYVKEHNLLQLVEDSMSFTDLINMNSESL